MFEIVNRLSTLGAWAPGWASGEVASIAAAWRLAQHRAERRPFGAGAWLARGRASVRTTAFWTEVPPVEAGWELDGYWLVWAPGPTPVAPSAVPWDAGGRAYAEICEAEVEPPPHRLDARA